MDMDITVPHTGTLSCKAADRLRISVVFTDHDIAGIA